MFHPFPLSPSTVRGDKKGNVTKSKPSPRRSPLAERSSIDTNQRSILSEPSSIRIVPDDGDISYIKTAAVSKSARIPPPKVSTVKRISHSSIQKDETAPTTTRPSSTVVNALLPLPVYPRRMSRQLDSVDDSLSSEADTITNYDSSISPTIPSTYSQSNTTLSTPTLNQSESAFMKPPSVLHQTGPNSQSTIRLVVPSISEEFAPSILSRRHSVSSVSSSVSDRSIIISPIRESEPPSRAATLLRAPNKHASTPAIAYKHESAAFAPNSSPLMMHPVRFETSVPIHPTETPKSSSAKIERELSPSGYPRASYAEPRKSIVFEPVRPVTLQYPIVREQAVNRVQTNAATRDLPFFSEKLERPHTPEDVLVHDESRRTSTRLSQVSSFTSDGEDEPAQYEVAKLEPIKSPRLRRVRGSIISPMASELKFPSFPKIRMPQPVFPRSAILGPSRRESEEGEDTLGDLPEAPRLHPKRSGYLTKFKALSKNASSDSLHSQLSFSGELDWVKRFYSGSSYSIIESPYSSPYASMSRLNTATSIATSTSPISEAFPTEIFRPRNRPRIVHTHSLRPRPSGDSIATQASWSSRIPRPQWVSSVWGSSVIFSPHLRPDRHAPPQTSALRPPSLEDPSKAPFGPIGRQIILFSCGFVFPVAWFVAAFLSIPEKPETLDEKGPREKGIPRRADPSYLKSHVGTMTVEQLEKQYVKAHWWRSLNRIMCVAGLAIIGALIALIILALRIHA